MILSIYWKVTYATFLTAFFLILYFPQAIWSMQSKRKTRETFAENVTVKSLQVKIALL